jgi:hypothetical protein
MDPYLLTDYCVANISWEYIYKVIIMIKKVQKVIYEATCRHIQEETKLHNYCRENIKPHWRSLLRKTCVCAATVN